MNDVAIIGVGPVAEVLGRHLASVSCEMPWSCK